MSDSAKSDARLSLFPCPSTFESAASMADESGVGLGHSLSSISVTRMEVDSVAALPWSGDALIEGTP